MDDKMFRKLERKYCLLTHRYVDAAFVIKSLQMEDGSRQDQIISIECPYSKKCRKQEINCKAIWPDSGKDPFTVEGNLLADLW